MSEARQDRLERLPDAALVVDGERRILAANTAAGELLGTSPESLAGTSLDRWLGQTEVADAWSTFLASGRYTGSSTVTREDGRRLVLEHRGRHHASGEHVWLLEEASAASFALLPDQLPFVISRFDRQRRHIFVSKAITRYTGQSPDVLVGKTNEELGMPAELLGSWNAAIDAAFAGDTTALTFQWGTPEGERSFASQVLPERGHDGRVDAVLVIARDVTDEKAALRALADAAEERLHRIERDRKRLEAVFAESLAAVTVLRGDDFRIELMNPRARELWGRGDALLGKPLLEALPELQGQGFEDLMRGVVATGTAFRGAAVGVPIDRDGTGMPVTRYFDFIYAPLRLSDDSVDGVIVHAHDVTDMVFARDRMQLATKTTGVGIWEWNVVTGEVRWDAQMREIYGLPDGAPVTYETWTSAVLPHELAAQEAILRDTVARKGTSTRSFRIVRRDDGRVRDVACVESVRVDATGRAEWVVGTNLDVTEQRTAERALRVSEARFRAMADHVPQLAWMADRNGYLDWFNQRWLDYTGTGLEANLGDGWKQVHHADHVERVAEKFARHLREGKDWEDTFPLRGRDGTYRWFLSRMTVIRDAAGDVVRFFGTNTDITDQRDGDRRKDEFLATLAHELRNPLAPIQSGLTLLRTTEPHNATRTLDIMDRQLRHLVRLVDDLLDISRVRSGKITLANERVPVRDVVDHAIEACRPSLDAKSHHLVVDVTTEPLVLVGDRTRLVQILANVLTNAAKYTDRGGRIELTVRRDGAQTVIHVKDNGVGIAPEQIGTLWDMFTQVRDTLEKAQGGLGIGLSLARRLVLLHGGAIGAESPGLGLGSTFEIRLPLAPAITSAIPAPRPLADARPASAHRILVVDDNVDGADTLSMLLSYAGHEVKTAHTGESALELASAFAPDVILLDIGLPDLDGYAVARRLRADPTHAPTLLVALTGWGSAEDRARTRDAGFDAHLTKPIQLSMIQDVLGRIGNRAR